MQHDLTKIAALDHRPLRKTILVQPQRNANGLVVDFLVHGSTFTGVPEITVGFIFEFRLELFDGRGIPVPR
jgi:hypothetical protein